METAAETMELTGWTLTRSEGSAASASLRLQAAEALSRFAEAEKYRAEAQLHDEAQLALPPQWEALEDHPGMKISLRTGKMLSNAATEAAAMEIALVRGISPAQGQQELTRAETLAMDTPEVLESLALGRVGATHVQRIVDQAQSIVPEPVPLLPRDAGDAEKEAWERQVAQRAAAARTARRDFGVDMLQSAPGRSPSQLRIRGRQVLERYYGVSFTKRSRKALRDRRIFCEDAGDGMSWFSGFLPTASCEAIFSRIDTLARVLKADPESAAATHAASPVAPAGEAGGSSGPGSEGGPADDPAEPRTMDQLRADIFMDMMLDGPTKKGLANVKAEVIISIPATMLPGLPGGPTDIDETPTEDHGDPAPTSMVPGPDASAKDHPATGEAAAGPTAGLTDIGRAELRPGSAVPTLLGGKTVDQESAVALMSAAKTWWRVVTDPITGAIIDFDRDRYRPTAAQRAALRFRDASCRTAGCTGAFGRCDVDHVREWQDGGGTNIANLVDHCRKCHRMKSLGLITTELRAGGTLVVTSLFGTRRISYPAAPWTPQHPERITSDASGPTPGDIAPPPADPDGEVPVVDELPYHPPRGSARPALPPGEQAPPKVTTDRWDGQSDDARRRHYEELQLRDWGRAESVPDPSTEHPEHGRYAQTNYARVAREMRIKRIAGHYRRPVPRPVQTPAERQERQSQASFTYPEEPEF